MKDLKQEIHHELNTLKDELKEEISTLQQEIECKLQTQKSAQTAAQVRIAELEEWKTDMGEVMMEMLEQTRQMQEEITDLKEK